jgi:protein-S-isoprenylcysteine O-methyltransferase Ste14
VWGLLNHVVVPIEERDLEARFGESYRQYKSTVQRWMAKTWGWAFAAATIVIR